MRSLVAFTMYVAIVGAYLVGVSPLSFALIVAIVLGLGLWAHSVDIRTPSNFSASSNSSPSSMVPSLSESMEQLHVLQTEINQLQAQFATDGLSRLEINSPYGSAS